MTTYIPSPDQGSAFHEDPASWSLALWGGREMRRKAWTEKRYTSEDWAAFNRPMTRTRCLVLGCPETATVTPGSLGVCWLHVGPLMRGEPFAVRPLFVPSGSPEWQSEHDRRRGYAPGKVGHL